MKLAFKLLIAAAIAFILSSTLAAPFALVYAGILLAGAFVGSLPLRNTFNSFLFPIFRLYDAKPNEGGGAGGDDGSFDIKTAKDLEKALLKTKSELEKKAKDDAKAEVTEQLKAVNDKLEAIKGLPAEISADELKSMRDDLKATIKALDILQSRMKSNPLPAVIKTFGSEFGEKLLAKEAQLKEFRVNKKGFGSIELETKAVGNMSSASNLTGSYFVAPTVVPGVEVKPYESVHMRNLLPVGNTNSNTVRYVRDNGGEGGPGMVAEAGAKPQIDRDLQIYDANVRKIATYFRVPEEMIDDIPYLQTFLSQIGIEEVMKLEDTQILYGDGTGQNLSGLVTNATYFDAGGSTVDTPNRLDVLLAAKKQGRVAKYNVSVALISPSDFFELITTKDTTKNYIFLGGGNGIDATNVIQTKGLRIVEHTSITDGDFLAFDPQKAAIFDRMGTTVRFYDQDQDNAIKNLITIVIEKRLALPIFQPNAFIYGTFTNGIAGLTNGS